MNNDLSVTSKAIQKAQQYNEAAEGAFAENTERARKADWAIFQSWCDKNGKTALPCSSETVVKFVDAQAESKKTATVKRYLTTISAAHKASGLDNPVKNEYVRLAVRRMARTYGTRQSQAKALNWPRIDIALRTLPETPHSLLDKALISVAYDTLCRRSEVVAIEMSDISLNDDGSATVLIRKSKTDQTGGGQVKYLAPSSIEHLKKWLSYASITCGSVFRGIDRWGNTSDKSLSTEGLVRSFRRVADHTGLDISEISGHSTRVGACQDLVSAGIEMSAIMQAGGWKNSERVARYSEQLQARRGGMAKLAAIQNR